MSDIQEKYSTLLYRIWSRETDKLYIGTTKNTLQERLYHHEKSYKYFTEGKRDYRPIFDILKFPHEIELIETVHNSSKTYRYKREGFWIRNSKNTVNKNIAGRTIGEYHAEEGARVKKRNAESRLKNRSKARDATKKYFAEKRISCPELYTHKHKCDCGGQYLGINKSIHINTRRHRLYEEKKMEKHQILKKIDRADGTTCRKIVKLLQALDTKIVENADGVRINIDNISTHAVHCILEILTNDENRNI